MSIRLQLPKITELKPRITVFGVGGAGGNAINNMIASGLTGVEFIAANTDAQALAMSSAEHRIQLGVNLTEGLGAGSRPEVGEAAAEEALEEIRAQIRGTHMVFVAAGMGGGTGTGAAAVIARAAKELGILVVGVVTKPFQFEGARRMRMAEAGIAELKQYVDTLIVIPNQNLFRLANEKTTFAEAFVLADQVLYSGVACIVDLIVKEGLINLDFADVRTVMKNMGSAMMGTGEGSGERRAVQAAEEAITNPLLDNMSLKGARGLLLSIIGGRDLTLYEVDEAASRVRQEVDPEANIIVGASFDETLGDRVRVSIVASGMERTELEKAGGHYPASSAPRPAVPSANGPAAQPILSRSHEPATARDLQNRIAEAMTSQTQHYQSTDHQAHNSGQAALDDTDGPLDLGPALEVQTRAGESWHAPGNVVIEERRPQQNTTPDAQGPGASWSPDERGHPGQSFHPAPPVEIPSTSRRMPEVADFPPIGQKEYRAKAGQSSQFGQPPMPPPEPMPVQPGYGAAPQAPKAPPIPEARRRGFFERLTGRKAPESRESRPHISQTSSHIESPLRPVDKVAGPQQTRSAPGTAPIERQSGQGESGRHANSDVRHEDIELPMFFHRENK